MKVHSTHNQLLHRKEVNASVESSANPGFADVQKQIAEHFKVGEDMVVVRSVRNRYGTHMFTIEASVYDSADAKMMIERKPKEKKVAN